MFDVFWCRVGVPLCFHCPLCGWIRNVVGIKCNFSIFRNERHIWGVYFLLWIFFCGGDWCIYVCSCIAFGFRYRYKSTHWRLDSHSYALNRNPYYTTLMYTFYCYVHIYGFAHTQWRANALHIWLGHRGRRRAEQTENACVFIPNIEVYTHFAVDGGWWCVFCVCSLAILFCINWTTVIRKDFWVTEYAYIYARVGFLCPWYEWECCVCVCVLICCRIWNYQYSKLRWNSLFVWYFVSLILHVYT